MAGRMGDGCTGLGGPNLRTANGTEEVRDMRLEKVRLDRWEARFSVLCIKCGNWTPAWDAFADLEGKPFEDYYCPKCAAEAEQLSKTGD